MIVLENIIINKLNTNSDFFSIMSKTILHSCIHTDIYTHIHTSTLTHAYTHVLSHTHTHTRTYTHTHRDTHTHTLTYIQLPTYIHFMECIV